MTQQEFESRTNISMSADEFDRVHDIYMACGDNVDKDTFCSQWKAKDFYTLLDKVTYEKGITEQAYKDVVAALNKEREQYKAEKSDIADFLLCKASAYEDSDLYKEAVRLVGLKEVILRKLRRGLPLWDEDIEYIAKKLL